MFVYWDDFGRGGKGHGRKDDDLWFIKKDGKVVTPNRNNLVRLELLFGKGGSSGS